MRVAILIQYDGSNYHGWQIQPELPTVQGFLENALEDIFQKRIAIVGSGRTDSGVHALGQVAHFDLENSNIPACNMWKSLNRLLPDDIRVLASSEVIEDFHSRFMATQREYKFDIVTSQNVLRRNSSWYVRFSLDLEKLQTLSEYIQGTHNFSSFCYAGSETENMICNIYEAQWKQESDGVLRFTVKADRFLHHMVRMLVGSMIEVARGKWKPERFVSLIDNPDRQNQTVTAPSDGLALIQVTYPEKQQPNWDQAQQNLVTSADEG